MAAHALEPGVLLLKTGSLYSLSVVRHIMHTTVEAKLFVLLRFVVHFSANQIRCVL